MKRNIILGGVAALALGAVAGGVAIAQQAPEPRPQAAERVSRADFVAQRVARVTAQDANRDGTVTADERRAAHEARRAERVADRFAKLDTNGDGSLSRAEFEAGHAMRGERMGRRGPGGPGGPGGPRPERVDRAERTMTVADGQARAERAFDRLDKDRDGYVTREERQDGRRGHRGGRGPHGPADMATPPAPGS